ncbi:TadE/TadG family type IV pilus assembly protein [Rhizobium sp. C4]|uniref:TadE/TadG family type IV pilus assembly protein n=1 Tax=Rhizobium sp. C4 TaxID=1349800 RepID=UPI003FA7C801
MGVKHLATEGKAKRASRLRRLFKSSEGATAIEFAILAIPFMMIVFATFETFIAFTGEQLVSNAVDTMARRVRTGQITFSDPTRTTTYMTQTQFRQEFCKQISVMITCSQTEPAVPYKLYIDLQQVTNFADIPVGIPLVATNGGKTRDIDVTKLKFTPGGAGKINMFRAYYRWPITTDLVRPYISNIQREGTTKGDFLIVATSAFQNENYP